MTSNPVTARPETTVEELATLMPSNSLPSEKKVQAGVRQILLQLL